MGKKIGYYDTITKFPKRTPEERARRLEEAKKESDALTSWEEAEKEILVESDD